METINVSSKSKAGSVAGYIAKLLETESEIEIQTIGGGAINQAVKAVAIARGYVAPTGYDVSCTPGFVQKEVGGEPRTAMRLIVRKW